MDRLLRPSVAELMAAFLITFISGGAICVDAFLANQGKASIGPVGIALAAGLSYAIAVSATARYSGGHGNPAVTLALLFVGRISAARAGYYLLAQFLGALIGGFFLTVIFGYTNAISPDVRLGTPHVHPLQALFGRDELNLQLMALATLIELLATFVLVFAWFATVIYQPHDRFRGIGVGLAATAAMLIAYQLTGAAMNPARYFGTALWDAGVNADNARLGDWYIYLLGPVLGAVLASWIYTTYVAGEETPPGEPVM